MPNFKEDKGGFKMDKPMKNMAYYKGKYNEGMSEAAQGMAAAEKSKHDATMQAISRKL